MSIVLERLTKHYDGHPVVNNVSLDIADGEFFVLLGSSGSGKTTILSLIAGLAQVDSGRILLHGRDVTDLPTRQRRVGFVFQNYALFQHMNVADNIEFGLSIRHRPRKERRRRCDDLLELVGLAGLGNRLPAQLSGGQQQRVALARALAFQPDVLLLDEPLGALDAKIRLELRRSLKDIQRKLGVAAILVTHDQEEAFDLADRLGVMSFGRLLEVGQPEELYLRPRTEFVAAFLGSANLLVGQPAPGGVRLGERFFPLAPVPHLQEPASENPANGQTPDISLSELAPDPAHIQVLFRPEDVALAASRESLDCAPLGLAEVEEAAFAGPLERLRLRLDPLDGVRPIAPPVPFGSRYLLVDATRSPDAALRLPLKAGDKAWVGVRRVAALSNPGLSFLVVADGTPRSAAAMQVCGQIARLAQARLTLLGCGHHRPDEMERLLQAGRKELGSGLAALETHSIPESPARALAQVLEQRPFDLVVLGFNPRQDLSLAESALRAGQGSSFHHLLLVPAPQATPLHPLICAAAGEPGKEDVLFTARLAIHLGGQATLLTVLPPGRGLAARAHAENFLQNGVQTLALAGVPAQPLIRQGEINLVLAAELQTGAYDMLVLGVPLPFSGSEITLSGVIGKVLTARLPCATLLVRSHYLDAQAFDRIE